MGKTVRVLRGGGATCSSRAHAELRWKRVVRVRASAGNLSSSLTWARGRRRGGWTGDDGRGKRVPALEKKGEGEGGGEGALPVAGWCSGQAHKVRRRRIY